MKESKTESTFASPPREQWTLITQGAEARVWKIPPFGNNDSMICKERFSKSYRHPDLDERLIKSRTRSEARVLEKCAKKSAIRVPKVLRVERNLVFMENIVGPTLKQFLLDGENSNNTQEVDYKILARNLGALIASLHNLGVIHGDLTTSNVLMEGQALVLIDFGLAKSTSSVEEQAVDLYVLERALQSTHPDLPEDFFDTILKVYGSEVVVQTKKHSQTTLQRLEQVRLRGRKRECFG